ncbi:ABC transporter ATP-binding protein [Stieleria sp. JC731]|uniref:ABC transporter ATP-binding protein n=1 Tax=Pirellulaceae TaxID=2691357 RepID=UPI001E514FBC|nr:ABC transporter ATP-binding protein [Stieleria sp. JC731]MCC9604061.1 ABC transporter ATP-binding protein [Stieleria sp. JC731]
MNTAPPASSIRCDHVTVAFGDHIAVSNVNLNIERGELVSLIGPSGCGKTTLLRSIAGLENITQGAVTIDPPAIANRGQIGFVFQSPALLPWATTLQNVLLPLELIGDGTSQSRSDKAMAALTAVQLDSAAGKLPDELSGGMKMRASIARALVTEPEVLLLDEPFAALDDMLRNDLGQLLLNLWQTHQFTAVMVTHNISESILLSKRIAVMRSGHLESVLNNPIDWPRSPEQIRTQKFAEFHGVVSDHLRGRISEAKQSE